MTMQTVFHIGGTRFGITVELRPAQHVAPGLTIDLQPIESGALELTITGTASSGSSGQIGGTLREAAKAHGVAAALELCDIWDRWHLNGLQAGTRAQLQYLETVDASALIGDKYHAKKAALAEAGLDPDKNTRPGAPYSYGSAWLFEPVPPAVVARLLALCEELDGTHHGSIDVDDLPEVDPAAHMIDSRDVITRLDGLRAALEAAGVDPDLDIHQGDAPELSDELADLWQECADLQALADEAECYGDWDYGTTLIRDSYFEEYARQFAEDVGAIDSDARWPACHIDWGAAADALKQDYTAVDFKGETYWIR